ncbi:alpha/beta hydrolase [Micromonospora globispora]|uniref:alpha/beta fold hydrolase n=1 Tax=Micromonospora globispora TaxID=1450148 RepID=UPI000D6EDA14|nr:alpha/beta hydrolase [Micromonospora globispora]PWU58944.1 alpha/beta hydrolase [Micromonospora globispora]
MPTFDGFEEFDIPTTGTTIRGRRGGAGPPVLLLHGIPETHLMWHRVAPQLAERFTVIATDLRGFGASGTPASTPDHAPYSMREIAREQVEVMNALGYDRFSVVGHDRGARCAYRMALDHPGNVARLAVLDVIPTADTFRNADKDFLLGFWIWSFLAAPEPVPEQLIARAPAVIVNQMLDSWSDDPDAFPPEVRAEYVDKFSDPDTIHAICEEYRASVTLDYEHDEADRGKRRITCPVLALWSQSGAFASRYQPLEAWRAWADEVQGGPIPAGHFLAEEAPGETARRLMAFLT